MKYNTEQALEEISKRGKQIRRKHEQNVTRALSAASFIMTLALITTIGIFTDTGAMTGQSSYGSFILSAQAGAYVLTAVVAFMLGVIVTIAIKHYRSKHDAKTNTNE